MNTTLRFVFLLLALAAGTATNAQNYFWIGFTGKSETKYTLENPDDYLSDRAIERRVRQNIPIDSLDLPVNQSYIDSVLTCGVTLVHSSKWLNGITVSAESDSLTQWIADWSFIGEIQCTKPAEASKSASMKFDETLEELVYADTSYYGASVGQVEMLNGQYFHENNYYGEGMHIAVLDAGFYNADILPAFDSLWSNNQILGTKDFVNPSSDIFDTHTHGMYVLSCMGANIPGSIVGTAPHASYWLLRSEDAGSEYILEEDNWVAAAEFADSAGVDIINSSLGYFEFDDESTNHEYADMDGATTRISKAANIAASRGMLVFVSAGNERDDDWFRIVAPSDADDVLGVGAVDLDLEPAYFTSAGPASDGDIKPNVAALGLAAVVQSTSGNLAYASGTSFSSPILAGVAACLWQKNSAQTASAIKQAIEASGNQYLSPDSLLGYGVPDMQNADLLLDPLGLEESRTDDDWQVYPNPFTDHVVLSYSGNTSDGEVLIRLISMDGQHLKTWKVPVQGQIVLNDFPEILNGIFLLQVRTNTQTEIIKLIKK